MPKASEPTAELFPNSLFPQVQPFRTQLLKWIGNKQRFAHEIASYFPGDANTYFEPFLGSGAILATLQPTKAIASDAFGPLAEIWKTLHSNPDLLMQWYAERFELYHSKTKPEGYELIKARFNANPNGADLLFLCRSCYGGVVRFRKSDGYMSTPCGVHSPISPDSFSKRVRLWSERTAGATFEHLDFGDAMKQSREGDLVYCDPPYTHSQTILYQGQGFSFANLIQEIQACKARGVRVALSIDGNKKSGRVQCPLDLPIDLFENEVFINCGSSMLRRFQCGGGSMESEIVQDRLLLTY